MTLYYIAGDQYNYNSASDYGGALCLMVMASSALTLLSDGKSTFVCVDPQSRHKARCLLMSPRLSPQLSPQLSPHVTSTQISPKHALAYVITPKTMSTEAHPVCSMCF